MPLSSLRFAAVGWPALRRMAYDDDGSPRSTQSTIGAQMTMRAVKGLMYGMHMKLDEVGA